MDWEVITFISGLLLAAAALLREMSNRRKTKKEAAVLEAKTPAEVDNLIAIKETTEFGRLIQLNEAIQRDNIQLRQDNEEWRRRWDDLDRIVQGLVRDQRNSERRTSRLEGWLTAAHQFIADFQRWGEQHAPGIKQPEPPPGYKPPVREEEEN